MTTTEFTTDQLKEIEEGRKAGIDVSVYEKERRWTYKF